MFRDPVVSRSIAAIGYAEDTETMEVEFHSGAIYRYHGVEADMHAKLLTAPSIGAFFNTHIRDAHPCVRVK